MVHFKVKTKSTSMLMETLYLH